MKDTIFDFNEDEVDYLRELINIGHGHCASVIAELLEEFVTLSVPKIELFHDDALKSFFERLQKIDQFYAIQAFWGSIAGKTLLIVKNESIDSLRKIFEEDEIEDDDIILELINIMNASLLSRIAMELDTDVSFDIPTTYIPEMVTEKRLLKNQNFNEAILMSTMLNFKDIDVNIDMIILMEDESIKWVHNKIKEKIDELLKWS